MARTAGKSLPPPKKYLQVARHVEDMIRQNKFGKGEKLPSDRRLAAMLNVTPVTVNKGLQLLARRNLLVRKVGSGTIVVSRKATTKDSYRIGIFIHVPPRSGDWYISTVMSYFHDFWHERKSEVLLLIKKGEEYRGAIDDHQLDGVMILAPDAELVPFIMALREKEFPLVSIGTYLQELAGCSFGTDHEATAAKAVAYLAGIGHERIGLVLPIHGALPLTKRAEGYYRAMWQAGLPVNPEWLLKAEDDEQLGALVAEMSRRKALPQALLLAAGGQILPLCAILRRQGLKVPDDLSLMGFDDMPFTSQLPVPLTVFSQPLAEITRQAAEALLAMMRGEVSSHLGVFESELILRASCAPPKRVGNFKKM